MDIHLEKNSGFRVRRNRVVWKARSSFTARCRVVYLFCVFAVNWFSWSRPAEALVMESVCLQTPWICGRPDPGEQPDTHQADAPSQDDQLTDGRMKRENLHAAIYAQTQRGNYTQSLRSVSAKPEALHKHENVRWCRVEDPEDCWVEVGQLQDLLSNTIRVRSPEMVGKRGKKIKNELATLPMNCLPDAISSVRLNLTELEVEIKQKREIFRA